MVALFLDTENVNNLSSYYSNYTKENLLEIIANMPDKDIKIISRNVPTEREIRNLLNRLDFNITTIGYKYVVYGIQLAYMDKSLISPIKKLYVEIGKKYNISYEKIYRSIDSSINTMNRRISNNKLKSFFYTSEHSVTPKEFFEIIVDYFLDEY